MIDKNFYDNKPMGMLARKKNIELINRCRRTTKIETQTIKFATLTLIINSMLHVTMCNIMFYIALFNVALLDTFNHLRSNLNLKLLPLNSGN